jgi:predicted MarR family transcription regulator
VPGITSPEFVIIDETASRDLPKSISVLCRHAEVDRKPNIKYL